MRYFYNLSVFHGANMKHLSLQTVSGEIPEEFLPNKSLLVKVITSRC